MPRSFLIKKKSDNESSAERVLHPGPDEDVVGDNGMAIDERRQPADDLAALSRVKRETSAVEDMTKVLVPPARRTTAIWSPAADLNVTANVKTSAVSPASGLTPFTPLSAAATAAAFLHPKGKAD